jgi:hypothetical protein
MLGNFINNNESLSNSSKGKSSAGTAAEVKEGAEKLARELEDYLNNNSKTKHSILGRFINSSTSGEAVADLQLATARKLREVRNVCEMLIPMNENSPCSNLCSCRS